VNVKPQSMPMKISQDFGNLLNNIKIRPYSGNSKGDPNSFNYGKENSPSKDSKFYSRLIEEENHANDFLNLQALNSHNHRPSNIGTLFPFNKLFNDSRSKLIDQDCSSVSQKLSPRFGLDEPEIRVDTFGNMSNVTQDRNSQLKKNENDSFFRYNPTSDGDKSEMEVQVKKKKQSKILRLH